MEFTTSNIIMIILLLSFIISIPLGLTAIFVSPEPKLVNGKTIYSYDTKIILGSVGGVLFIVPFIFLIFDGTKLLF